MSLPVRLLPEARDEFDQAVDWYERQRSGLGTDFIARVREVFTRIASNPGMYPATHQGARKATVRQFPYVVIYREEPTEIIVIAVFHTSRDPSQWRGRA